MNLKLDQLQSALEKVGRLPRAYRMALLPALAALVCGGYLYVFYSPAKTTLDSVRQQVLQAQRRLAEVRAVAANEAAVKAEIEALEAKLEVALRQLPDSKELPVLLTDITSLGKTAGLDFRAFRPLAETRREFYAEVPIDIEFVGRFHDIASFFDALARLPRIVNIGRLEMSIAGQTAHDTVLSVKGSATTFRFVEPPAASDSSAGSQSGRQRARGGRQR